MVNENKARRSFMQSSAFATAGLMLVPGITQAQNMNGDSLTADLMEDHGILRRALHIYQHCASRLQASQPNKIETARLAKSLNETARIFRLFGEDYHERALEEKHVFPILMKAQSDVSRYPALLTAQHERGRKMTSYVQDTTRDGVIPSGQAKGLANALNSFKLMYEHHAAHEDTVIFRAWRSALSEAGIKELQQVFAETENRMLGKDGYEESLKRIVAIEANLGIADLTKFTMPNI
jgi:hemerythrin-like domain-containing protein